MMSAPQDDERTTGSTPDPIAMTPSRGPVERSAPATEVAVGARAVFTPRWGRIAVAMAGLLALVAAPITLLLGVLGVVPLLVPLVCIAVTATSVALLRMLAIRSRRARVDAAFAQAMAPVREPAPVRPETAGIAAPQRPTALFDAEQDTARPLTAMELRTAALAVANGSTVVATHGDEALDGAQAEQPAGATAWVPVDLPRPTYVDAPKAERVAPAPLDLPEAPRPTSRMPIKASEAAARVAPATDDAADAPVDSTPATGRINLDDVLQRRRA